MKLKFKKKLISKSMKKIAFLIKYKGRMMISTK
jgi:hypothetical protein